MRFDSISRPWTRLDCIFFYGETNWQCGGFDAFELDHTHEYFRTRKTGSANRSGMILSVCGILKISLLISDWFPRRRWKFSTSKRGKLGRWLSKKLHPMLTSSVDQSCISFLCIEYEINFQLTLENRFSPGLWNLYKIYPPNIPKIYGEIRACDFMYIFWKVGSNLGAIKNLKNNIYH